ncbi:helix-turn-helix domain-containing protein [Sinomonas sp. P10A9]|uniref:Helix-turn-helix domain-containing protein n=1 Tax=Sinomonas puerhi TaxID=3238584 RepID=A0AB39L0T4_9MICC
MSGRTWFNVRTDGSVVFRAEDWGRLAAYVSRKVREDAQRNGGGYSPLLLGFVDAAQTAEHLMFAFAPEARPEVPLSELDKGKPEKMWVSAKEAAKRNGCSVEYMRRIARRGQVPARRAGREWLIDPEAVRTPE